MTVETELQAGPALDAEIARVVFGWVDDPWIDPFNGERYAFRLPDGTADNPAPYSTTWEGLGLVVERMRERDIYFAIEPYSTGYTITNFHEYDGEYTIYGSSPQPQVETWAPTAPHAVCLAALRALAGKGKE